MGPGLWVLPSLLGDCRSLISQNLLYSLQRTLETTTGGEEAHTENDSLSAEQQSLL